MKTRAKGSAADDTRSRGDGRPGRAPGVLEPDTHVLLTLAERHRGWTAEITGSEELRSAVARVRSVTGATPHNVAAMLRVPDAPTGQSPVALLVAQCAEVVRDARPNGVAPTGEPATAAPPPARAVTATPDAAPLGSGAPAPPTDGAPRPEPPPSPQKPASPTRARQATELTEPPAGEQPEPVPRERPEPFAPSSPVRQRRPQPTRGWRKAVHRASGGAVNPGPGPTERAWADFVRRVQTPVRGYRNTAVISMTGGTGKTTVAAMVGHVFARFRGDRVLALEASPHPGTLAHRVPAAAGVSPRELLARESEIRRYADLREVTAQAPSRLEIVASAGDPSISRPLGGEEYVRAVELLSCFYTIILTDGGAGTFASTTPAVLAAADQLVVVAAPTVDGTRATGLLLDWLDAHDYGELAASGVVVINAVPEHDLVDTAESVAFFSERVRAVRTLPWDAFLAIGAGASLESVARETRLAYLDLAACVADGLAVDG